MRLKLMLLAFLLLFTAALFAADAKSTVPVLTDAQKVQVLEMLNLDLSTAAQMNAAQQQYKTAQEQNQANNQAYLQLAKELCRANDGKKYHVDLSNPKNLVCVEDPVPPAPAGKK